MKIISTVFILLFLSACASKPVLYPNGHLKRVGKKKSQSDIKLCMAEADEYMESSDAKRILKSAGKGSIFGSAVGAVTGLLTGDVIGGVTSGAVIGGTAGGVGEAISPDQLERNYVNHCLHKKGYKIIGWD